MDDMKGLKVRASGEGETMGVKLSGATPVYVSIKELAQALEEKSSAWGSQLC